MIPVLLPNGCVFTPVIKPISDPEYLMYSEPIPIELAKQWDLRTLSKYLPPPITQEQIDEWYPEPTAQIGELECNDTDESTTNSD
jgi:hypothetical protein